MLSIGDKSYIVYICAVPPRSSGLGRWAMKSLVGLDEAQIRQSSAQTTTFSTWGVLRHLQFNFN